MRRRKRKGGRGTEPEMEVENGCVVCDVWEWWHCYSGIEISVFISVWTLHESRPKEPLHALYQQNENEDEDRSAASSLLDDALMRPQPPKPPKPNNNKVVQSHVALAHTNSRLISTIPLFLPQ